MKALEDIRGDNWKAFTEAPLAVLVIGKTTCNACQAWTEALSALLTDQAQAADLDHVRFGKLYLDQSGMTDFKRENPWLAKEVDALPFNVIYRNGERVKSFPGAGIDRLKTRLAALPSEMS